MNSWLRKILLSWSHQQKFLKDLELQVNVMNVDSLEEKKQKGFDNFRQVVWETEQLNKWSSV